MTARLTVTLTCNHKAGCAAVWIGQPKRTIAQTRAEAGDVGWTTTAHQEDGCPSHPRGKPTPATARRTPGTVIRLYDQTGRLLYVSSTQGSVAGRIGAIRYQQKNGWWPQVDPSRTLVEAVPPDVDPESLRDHVVLHEHPRFWRDGDGRQPYLHYTRHVPPGIDARPWRAVR